MEPARPEWLSRPLVKSLIELFEQENLPLRFVGGAVRDHLLGRPVADIDAATPVMPEMVLALLEKHRIRAIPTGLAHGTITAVKGKQQVEITTLRRDVETDGRHAVVAFTDSWRDDAARRDFTMNALSMSPDGRIQDYFGGEADARAGRVRFIGDPEQRIEEDRLRILRFFRFTATHGTPPADLAALGACETAVLGLVHLAGERIRAEMMKLLAAQKPLYALDLMVQTGALASVLSAPVSLDPLRWLLKQAFLKGDEALVMLRLSALLLGAADRERAVGYVTRRWRLPNREADLLRLLVTFDFSRLSPNKTMAQALVYRHGHLPAFQLLALAACLDPKRSGKFAYATLEVQHWQTPVFPIGGKELSVQGVAPGPGMGQMLKMLERRWIDSGFSLGKEELLAGLPPSAEV